MGAKSGTALKFLQWFIRAIQFLCAALILGVYAYFLAALSDHDLDIDTDVRAVAGISGAAALYTLIGLLLLCCLAGRKITSFIAILLDVAFIGAFIYVAVANRDGASSCRGYLDTPFGSGRAGATIDNNNGDITTLPSFRTACRLQSACLAVAIVAIIFFIFSILVEIALVRHHDKAKRFGPGPKNDYTSGYGKAAAGGGLFSRFRRKKTTTTEADENALPVHTTPDQFDNRQSYATENTAVNNPHDNPYNQGFPYNKPEPGAHNVNDNPYNQGATYESGVHNVQDNPYNRDTNYNKPETGYGYRTNNTGVPNAQQAGFQTTNYRYDDGVYDRS